MPTYEYKCDNCEDTFEYYQAMSSDKLTSCTKCNTSGLRRLPGKGGYIKFIGGGFYCNEHGDKK